MTGDWRRLGCAVFFGDFEVLVGWRTSLSCESQRLCGAEEAAKLEVWKKQPCLCSREQRGCRKGCLFFCWNVEEQMQPRSTCLCVLPGFEGYAAFLCLWPRSWPDCLTLSRAANKRKAVVGSHTQFNTLLNLSRWLTLYIVVQSQHSISH